MEIFKQNFLKTYFIYWKCDYIKKSFLRHNNMRPDDTELVDILECIYRIYIVSLTK